MNRVSVLFAVVLVLFAVGICQADSLVISYRSGKTQTVVLDEPGVGINSWQFVGGIAPLQQLKKMDETVYPPVPEQVQKEQVKDDQRFTEKAPERKSNIRVKVNAKPIRD